MNNNKQDNNQSIKSNAAGDLKPLRKTVRREAALTTFFTGTCTNTTTCCIT